MCKNQEGNDMGELLFLKQMQDAVFKQVKKAKWATCKLFLRAQASICSKSRLVCWFGRCGSKSKLVKCHHHFLTCCANGDMWQSLVNGLMMAGMCFVESCYLL